MPNADPSSRPRNRAHCARPHAQPRAARRCAARDAHFSEDADARRTRDAAPQPDTAETRTPRVRQSDDAGSARDDRSAERSPNDKRRPPLIAGSTVAAPPSQAFAHAKGPSSLHEVFRRMAHATAYIIGTPIAFFVAIVAIIAWAVSGPVFGYSDTWQLVINTGTTVVTFLVVFMIQNTQNRDSQAIHLKLDELIRAMKHARNKLVDVEDRSDEELKRLQREMRTYCNDPKGECDGDDDDDDDDDDGAARR